MRSLICTLCVCLALRIQCHPVQPGGPTNKNLALFDDQIQRDPDLQSYERCSRMIDRRERVHDDSSSSGSREHQSDNDQLKMDIRYFPENGRYPSKWPNNRVPASISSRMNQEDRRRLACVVLFFHEHTCIRFEPRTRDDTDYIRFRTRSGRGCYVTSLGKREGRNVVNFDEEKNNCWRHGAMVHSVMHALGLFHEQSREDRDQHIDIRWSKIGSRSDAVFKKASELGFTMPQSGSYDVGSVMHHSSSFITAKFYPKFSHCLMGNREVPSSMDAFKVNSFYECSNTGGGGHLPGSPSLPPPPSSTPTEQHDQMSNAIMLIGGSGAGAYGPDKISAANSIEYYFPNNPSHNFVNKSVLRAHSYAVAGELNGHIVMTGGNENPQHAEVFDSTRNIWIEAADLLYPRTSPTGGVIDGKLFVCGGKTTYNKVLRTCEYFNIETNRWTLLKQKMPQRSYCACSAVIASKLYVIGGFSGAAHLKTAIMFDYKANEWKTLESTHTYRHVASAAALGNHVYVCGGWSAGLHLCERYDPSINKWTAVAKMQYPRIYHSMVAFNGFLYVFGGNQAASHYMVEKYDPQDNHWTEAEDMAVYRYGMATVVTRAISKDVVVLDKPKPMPLPSLDPDAKDKAILLLGGTGSGAYGSERISAANSIEYYFPGRPQLNFVNKSITVSHTYSIAGVLHGHIVITGGNEDPQHTKVFDSKRNIWVDAAQLLYRRVHPSGAVINNQLYVCGGKSTYNKVLRTCEYFDINENKWQLLESRMPQRSQMAASAVLDDKLYIMGGHNGAAWLKTTIMFDASTGSWSELEMMHSARWQASAAALGQYIYICGGGSSHTSKLCERYNPSTNKWTAIAKMHYPHAYFTMVAFEGYLYAFGGNSAASHYVVEKYNPNDNHWYVTAETLMRRYAMASVVATTVAKEPPALPKPKPIPIPPAYDGRSKGILLIGGSGAGAFGADKISASNSIEYYFPDKPRMNFVNKSITVSHTYQMAGVLHGRVVMTGGNSNPQHTEIYDSVRNIWVEGADMRLRRVRPVGGVISNKLYVCGGAGEYNKVLSSCEYYDINENQWTLLDEAMPYRTQMGAAAVLNNKLYVMGGSGASHYLKVAMCYDGHEWKELEEMHSGRMYASAAALNGNVYVCGGGRTLNLCEKYDPATNKWTAIGKLKNRRQHFSLVSFNGHLYAFGGNTAESHYSVEEYDPDDNHWSVTTDMAMYRYAMAAVTLGGDETSNQHSSKSSQYDSDEDDSHGDDSHDDDSHDDDSHGDDSHDDDSHDDDSHGDDSHDDDSHDDDSHDDDSHGDDSHDDDDDSRGDDSHDDDSHGDDSHGDDGHRHSHSHSRSHSHSHRLDDESSHSVESHQDMSSEEKTRNSKNDGLRSEEKSGKQGGKRSAEKSSKSKNKRGSSSSDDSGERSKKESSEQGKKSRE